MYDKETFLTLKENLTTTQGIRDPDFSPTHLRSSASVKANGGKKHA
jgi:hypothetical protein